jgi:hypothetical protein
MLSYPGLIAGAMIFAIIVVQLRDQDYFSLIFITLFSVPLLGLLIFLSYKNLDLVGYVLILIPVILVWVGYRMGIKEPAPEVTDAPTPPAPGPAAPAPGPAPAANDNCRCARVPCVCPVNIT